MRTGPIRARRLACGPALGAALAVAIVASASACAWIRPSSSAAAPREVGPNTYELSKRGTVGMRRGSVLKLELVEEAGTFCQAKGKGMTLLDARSDDPTPEDEGSTGTFASAIIHFGCV